MQTALGHAALPLACRQFPRVTIRDPRGVFVTLSHYCPTAADMLSRPARPKEPDEIVESAGAFPRGGEYEGLDARGNLPPLLRPNLLMDWESWSIWERLVVEQLTRGDASASAALSAVSAAVETARAWVPSRGPLGRHLAGAFSGAASLQSRSPVQDDQKRLDEVLAAIPSDVRERFAEPRLKARERAPVSDVVRRRFLAAHAFANWTAHLGAGLRTWLRSLAAADALLTLGLGVDGADLLLRHLADPAALAQAWSAAETDPAYSADMNG